MRQLPPAAEAVSALACMPRSRGLLLSTVDRLDPEHNYLPVDLDDDGRLETRCNFFAADVCRELGVELPRVRAREQIAWLKSYPGLKAGWTKLSDPKSAMELAERGHPVLAGWVNPDPSKSSHIALVVPALDTPGMHVAQAGKHCFNNGPLERGFGRGVVVELFSHE